MALQKYIAGEVDLAQLRRELSNSLYGSLEPADAITIEVDGGAQVFTFLATRGIHIAASATSPPASGGETLVVSFDGGLLQTVTFTGAATSADLLAGEINSQVTGGRCVNVAGTLQLESDTRGTGSAAAVDVTSSASALTITGFAAGSTAGTGNVINIDAVTITEVIALLSTLAGAVATDNSRGHFGPGGIRLPGGRGRRHRINSGSFAAGQRHQCRGLGRRGVCVHRALAGCAHRRAVVRRRHVSRDR